MCCCRVCVKRDEGWKEGRKQLQLLLPQWPEGRLPRRAYLPGGSSGEQQVGVGEAELTIVLAPERKGCSHTCNKSRPKKTKALCQSVYPDVVVVVAAAVVSAHSSRCR